MNRDSTGSDKSVSYGCKSLMQNRCVQLAELRRYNHIRYFFLKPFKKKYPMWKTRKRHCANVPPQSCVPLDEAKGIIFEAYRGVKTLFFKVLTLCNSDFFLRKISCCNWRPTQQFYGKEILSDVIFNRHNWLRFLNFQDRK